MNAMNRFWFTRVLAMRCNETGDAASAAAVQDPPVDDGKGVDGAGGKPVNTENYVGSKTLNSEQRPLKGNFDRTGLSEKQIDDMLVVMGPEMLMSDAEIAALGADQKKGDEDKKAKEKADKNKPATPPKPKEGDDEEKDAADFLTATGLKQEQFAALPENTRKFLVERYEGAATDTSSLKKQADEYKSLLDAYKSDPVMVARAQELRSPGAKLVASELPPIQASDLNDDFLNKVDEEMQSGSKDSARKTILDHVNKLVKAHTKDIVRTERAALEQQQEVKQLQSKAFTVVKDIAKMSDGKLVVTDDDFKSKPAPESEFGKLMKFMGDRGYSLKTIVDMGPEEIFAAYSVKSGWAQKRDQNIRDETKRNLMDKLMNPKAARSSIAAGRSSAPSRRSGSVEGSLDGLETGLVEGKPEAAQRLSALITANEGNPDMLRTLEQIQTRADAKRKQGRSVRP